MTLHDQMLLSDMLLTIERAIADLEHVRRHILELAEARHEQRINQRLQEPLS